MQPEKPLTPSEMTKDLRGVFEPLCELTAESSEPENINQNDPEIVEQVAQLPEHKLPTHRDFAMMPWDALLGQDFSDPDALRQLKRYAQLKDAWIERHPELRYKEIRRTSERKAATRRLDYGLRAVVFGEAKGHMDVGNFDEPRWRHYEQYMSKLPPDESARLEKMQAVRNDNIAKWWRRGHVEEMRQAEAFLHIRNDIIPANELLSNLNLPVGAYGEEFTRDMLQSVAIMQGVAEKHVIGLAAEQTKGHEELLHQMTARAAEDEKPTERSTMKTLHEGVLSIGQAISIVTMEKVEGFDDPYELLQAIVDNGLVDRLARYAAMGLVGPMSQAGLYLPNSLVRTPEGGVAFSDEFEGYLKEQKAKYIAAYVLKAQGETSHAKETKYLGTICPVANMGGGISKMAETYARLVTSRREQKAA